MTIRGFFYGFIERFILSIDGCIIYYQDTKPYYFPRSRTFALIKKIKEEKGATLKHNELYNLFMAVKRTDKIKGDIAEVGVYKGNSAKIICEAKGSKILHLFDTFEGLPTPNMIDDEKFHKGDWYSSIEEVKDCLKEYFGVFYHKGLFPYTTDSVINNKFSFVHLDTDLYLSTKSSLEFFYPRMQEGGIILSHDYVTSTGVRKAFDDFFEDRIEPIIDLSGSQCLIIKTSSENERGTL